MKRFVFLIVSVMIFISVMYLENQKAENVWAENTAEQTTIYVGISDVMKFTDKLCTKDMLDNIVAEYNFIDFERFDYLLFLSLFFGVFLFSLLKLRNYVTEKRALSFEPCKQYFLMRYIHKEDGKKRLPRIFGLQNALFRRI